MVRAYELGVPALDAEGVARMRAALDRAAAHAAAGELIEHWPPSTPCTDRLRGDRQLRVRPCVVVDRPRFDRVLYLWYTESILEVGRSYRHDLVVALERGEPDEAVEIMRRAWRRFRDLVAERDDEDRP